MGEPDEPQAHGDPAADYPLAVPGAGQPVHRPPAPTSTLAIASFVIGVLGILSLCCSGGIAGLVSGPAAIFPGMLARKEVARSRGEVSGDGLAIAGVVMGWLSLAAGILALLVLLVPHVLGWFFIWQASSSTSPIPPGPGSPPVPPGVP